MASVSHAALLKDALELPADDRLALATELLHSVEDRDDSEWSQAWAAEIARRIRELNEGTTRAVPWSQVRAELKARFAAK